MMLYLSVSDPKEKSFLSSCFFLSLSLSLSVCLVDRMNLTCKRNSGFVPCSKFPSDNFQILIYWESTRGISHLNSLFIFEYSLVYVWMSLYIAVSMCYSFSVLLHPKSISLTHRSPPFFPFSF